MTTIDLAPLFSGEQHETKISLSMPLDGITDDIVSGTAEVNGTCTDRVGFAQLHLRIRLNATAICSRCARQFPYRASMERVCRLIAGETGSEDEEEDYYILDGTVLDAQALSRELIILGVTVSADVLRQLQGALSQLRSRPERGLLQMRFRASRPKAGKADGACKTARKRTIIIG